MAISRTQTAQSQSAVQAALAQRERKEAQKRKEQEEREAKERQLQATLRALHFENERKERERQERLEQEEQAREAALARREAQRREVLRYGPQKAKASKWPKSDRRARDEVRRRRASSEDADDSSGGSSGLPLTREEKRQRKFESEMRQIYPSQRRATPTKTKTVKNGQLPGGDIILNAPLSLPPASSSEHQSVKARVLSTPPTWTKLNTVKKDPRTIDEIMEDLRRARETLTGEEAKKFKFFPDETKRKNTARKAVTASASDSAASHAASQPSSTSKSAGMTTMLCRFYTRPFLVF
jgi:protein SPT2